MTGVDLSAATHHEPGRLHHRVRRADRLHGGRGGGDRERFHAVSVQYDACHEVSAGLPLTRRETSRVLTAQSIAGDVLNARVRDDPEEVLTVRKRQSTSILKRDNFR